MTDALPVLFHSDERGYMTVKKPAVRGNIARKPATA